MARQGRSGGARRQSPKAGPRVESNRASSRGVFEEREQSPEGAFEAFTQDLYGRIVATVRLIVRDHHTAQDLTQEAFARAYLNWPKLWPDGNPAGWVYRVATNLALSSRRRATREIRAIARLQSRTALSVPAPEAHPELHRAIAKLPPRQRAAVALHYILGLTMDEAADAMRCAPGTVKSLLHTARGRLRDELGEEEEEDL
jgi:RNA polymerase sigma-70 factor (ECF subfamily)